MSEGIKEQINQAVKDRLSNPVWGYIILSWLGFNWESLAILFMSEAPLKVRLDYITSQEHHLILFFVAPVVTGSLIAILTPYIQWLLSEAHKWADNKHREAINSRLERQYEDQESMAEKKARGANAERLAQAKADADVIIEVERGKQAQNDTKNLEENLKNLQERNLQEEKLNEKIAEATLRLKKEDYEWKVRIARIINKLEELDKSKSVVSIADVKQALKSFYLKEDIEHAMKMVQSYDESDFIHNALNSEAAKARNDDAENSYKDYAGSIIIEDGLQRRL